MPKIDAPTVAEHRARVQERLVDAAEQLLRAGEPLTAQAVTEAAGIARNSVYRYVDAVSDLYGMVIARYLPAWLETVRVALADERDPGARVVRWVTANLTEADSSGHGWLMTATPPAAGSTEVDAAHSGMRGALDDAWRELIPADPDRAAAAAALTMGVLQAGFRQLAAGRAPAMVIDVSRAATEGLVDRLRSSE